MQALAATVLAVHLAWIVWVIFGALWTRGRVLLTAFHIASLVWGVVVETSPLPCPLTSLEQFFEAKAGIDPYGGSFLVHYLDRIVYPEVSESLLVYCGAAVCIFNLLVYVRRYLSYRKARN